MRRLLRRLPHLGAALACGLATACSAAAHPAAPPPQVPPASSATPATVRPHLAYAALGASETFGIGASPVTEGYAYRLRDELGLGPSSFADVGIPGATLGAAYETELANALAIQPTVCTVFFGVNDIRAGIPLTRFRSDLTDLVTTLRRAGARVLVIGIPDLTHLPALRSMGGAELVSLAHQWSSAMHEVASATGAAFLDLDGLSGELAAHPEEVAADGLHPSNLGHARLAAAILAALRAQGDVGP